MEENEVQALDVQEQEVTSEAEVIEVSKSEYTKLKRQALAYQASKGKAETKVEATPAFPNDKFLDLELKVDGYAPDEINYLKEIGVQHKDNPLVQKALMAMREERKSKEADASIPNKSAVYKNYTIEDFKNMSVEEMRKVLPHAE